MSLFIIKQSKTVQSNFPKILSRAQELWKENKTSLEQQNQNEFCLPIWTHWPHLKNILREEAVPVAWPGLWALVLGSVCPGLGTSCASNSEEYTELKIWPIILVAISNALSMQSGAGRGLSWQDSVGVVSVSSSVWEPINMISPSCVPGPIFKELTWSFGSCLIAMEGWEGN